MHRYVKYYDLKEPSDDILDVLINISIVKKKIKLHRGFDSKISKMYDIDAAGSILIKDFFDGNLGKIMLDNDVLMNDEQNKQSKNENDDINYNQFV
jgi:hypothetical protein